MKYLIVILFALSACSGGIKTLPSSTGMLSEVVFVVEDPLWEKHIKDIVLKTFGTPIEGLLQNELSFKLVQVNPSEFKSILKTHKNIIIIAENVLNSSKKDKWAKGQLVVQFEFKREDNKLITDLNRLKKVFEFREIKTLKKSISKSSQKEQEIKIKEQFDVEILIPVEYTIIKDTATLFWATYNPKRKDEIKHLFVFSFDPKTTSIQEQVLEKTDSIFVKYLLGSKKGQHVKIENRFQPIHSEDTYRGIWKLEGGFMGGPFFIKTYFVNKKIVVTVGLIFAPNDKKRNYIKNLEAIL
jgi:hypothetical protein